jgi:chromosomal replication initiation ATPase DnaA
MLIDNPTALIHAAADVMGVLPDDVTGKRKTFAESLARQIVMTLWAENHSLQSSCEIVGREHHTSAFYARRKIHERLGYCEATRERLAKVMQKYSEIILNGEKSEPKIAANAQEHRP